MGNCLRQPGQLRNQLNKSMLSTSIHLLNFVYRDYSCYPDKVNRASGHRSVVMVFASPLRQFYRDVINPAHLPGLTLYRDTKLLPVYRDFAKTTPTPTQTATPHTTGPLAQIFQYVTIMPSHRVLNVSP